MKELSKLAGKSRRGWKRAASAVATGFAAVAAAPMALAQDSLGAAALAEVSSVKGDVSAILMVLVGVVFLLVAWAYFKRAR